MFVVVNPQFPDCEKTRQGIVNFINNWRKQRPDDDLFAIFAAVRAYFPGSLLVMHQPTSIISDTDAEILLPDHFRPVIPDPSPEEFSLEELPEELFCRRNGKTYKQL